MKDGVTGQPDNSDVRQALERILGSSAFRGSKRCQDFLSFVVTQALDGHGDMLKERTLAAEVFHRNVLAELGDDSIVRVGAREVRKRLAQCYVTDGAQDPVRIDLPSGSYVPLFRLAASLDAAHQVATHIISTELPPAPPQKKSRWTRRFVPVAAACALAAVVIAWQASRGGPSEFEDFWKPAFDPTKPLVFALAHPIVYHPSSRANQLNDARNGRPERPLQHPLQLPPEVLNGSDFVPVFDQYVGFGDTVAASRLTGLFAKRSHPVRMRLASKVEFADLRDSAVVLIGAFTNRWTVELTQSFRFRFSYSPKPSLTDATGGRTWMVADKSDDGRSTQDYILLSRLPQSQTGGFVVIGAGLTQYGTQEAGRILADPLALTPILKALPLDWPSRNLQIVLHSRIVEDSPASPDLITWHVW